MVLKRRSIQKPYNYDKLIGHFFWTESNAILSSDRLSFVNSLGSRNDPPQPKRCYNFDGVDDQIEIITAFTGTLYVSGVLMDETLDASLSITYSIDRYVISKSVAGKVFNIKIWSNNLATNEQKLAYEYDDIPVNLLEWFQCGESTGTNSYGVLGNYIGFIVNSSSGFHYEGSDVPYNWQNTKGYSTGKAFRSRPSDVKVDGTNGAYTSEEGIQYGFTSDEALADPEGDIGGWKEEGYYNLYKPDLSINGSNLMYVSSNFGANTIKIDLVRKSGSFTSLSTEDETISSKWHSRFSDVFGFPFENIANVEEFYYCLSGTDLTYGENYPENVCGLIGITSADLRVYLEECGISNVPAFIDDVASNALISIPTNTTYWNLMTKVFSINPEDTPVGERALFQLEVSSIIATNPVIGGGDYFLNYDRQLSVFQGINIRGIGHYHIYSISVQENFLVPASIFDPAKDALGDPLEFRGSARHLLRRTNVNVAEFDGITTLSFTPGQLTGVAVEEYLGTAAPTIDDVSGEIAFTEGYLYYLKLDNGSEYFMQAGEGNAIPDRVNGIPLTFANHAAPAQWGKNDEVPDLLFERAVYQHRYFDNQTGMRFTPWIMAETDHKSVKVRFTFLNWFWSKIIIGNSNSPGGYIQIEKNSITYRENTGGFGRVIYFDDPIEDYNTHEVEIIRNLNNITVIVDGAIVSTDHNLAAGNDTTFDTFGCTGFFDSIFIHSDTGYVVHEIELYDHNIDPTVPLRSIILNENSYFEGSAELDKIWTGSTGKGFIDRHIDPTVPDTVEEVYFRNHLKKIPPYQMNEAHKRAFDVDVHYYKAMPEDLPGTLNDMSSVMDKILIDTQDVFWKKMVIGREVINNNDRLLNYTRNN